MQSLKEQILQVFSSDSFILPGQIRGNQTTISSALKKQRENEASITIDKETIARSGYDTVGEVGAHELSSEVGRGGEVGFSWLSPLTRDA